MNRKTEELEEIIGYHFKNKHYLTQALTHSSYANEKKLGKLGSNERLELSVCKIYPDTGGRADKEESQPGV